MQRLNSPHRTRSRGQPVPITVKRLLRIARTKRGWTQEKLAEELANFMGTSGKIHIHTIQIIENENYESRHEPSIVFALHKLLDINTKYLVTDEDLVFSDSASEDAKSGPILSLKN